VDKTEPVQAKRENEPEPRRCANPDCPREQPLPASEFYWKPDREDWDSTCKQCRRSGRKKNYRQQTQKQASDPPVQEPVESVEPVDAQPTPEQAETTDTPVDDEDMDRAVKLFSMLRTWRDRARKNGQIKW